jgi:hypothetical protein
MSPKNVNSEDVVREAEVEVTETAITVKLPSKDDMPENNADAMSRFGDALTLLLERFNAADKGSDTKKKLRRQIRKLGYSLSEGRTRGLLTIEL